MSIGSDEEALFRTSWQSRLLSISTERRGTLNQMLTSWKGHGLELPDELRKKLDLTKNVRAELVLNDRIDFVFASF